MIAIVIDNFKYMHMYHNTMVSNHNEHLAVLKILIDLGEKYSIRKLSQIRRINYKSAYNAVMKLEKEGIVNVERLGNINMCSFNKKFDQYVFSVEDERRKDLVKNKDFLIMYNRLNELPFSLIVLLFGSHVKKTTNKHSDIDLLAITEREREVERAISLIPLKIHLITVTPNDFISMANSKEMTVVSEAIKRNVIIIGIEEYYRLLQHAR